MKKTIDSLRIARNIRNVRLANEMTQIEMGEALGYSERQIRRLETEGTYNINVINLIAEIFNVSAIDILSSDGMFCLYDMLIIQTKKRRGLDYYLALI